MAPVAKGDYKKPAAVPAAGVTGCTTGAGRRHYTGPMHRVRSAGRVPARPMVGFALAAAAALALVAAPAQAQWKWRDANGRIVISDVPPPRGVPDKDVLQRPEPAARAAPPPAAASGPAAASAAAGKAPVDAELEARKRRTEQEQAAQRKAEDAKAAAVRKDNCQRARDHLALLDSGQRMVRIGADGEREYLSDQQRAAEAQRTRDIVASDCR